MYLNILPKILFFEISYFLSRNLFFKKVNASSFREIYGLLKWKKEFHGEKVRNIEKRSFFARWALFYIKIILLTLVQRWCAIFGNLKIATMITKNDAHRSNRTKKNIPHTGYIAIKYKMGIKIKINFFHSPPCWNIPFFDFYPFSIHFRIWYISFWIYFFIHQTG